VIETNSSLSIRATAFTVEGLYFGSIDEITIELSSGSCHLANLTHRNGYDVLSLTDCRDLTEGPLNITLERFTGKSEPKTAYFVVPGKLTSYALLRF